MNMSLIYLIIIAIGLIGNKFSYAEGLICLLLLDIYANTRRKL